MIAFEHVRLPESTLILFPMRLISKLPQAVYGPHGCFFVNKSSVRRDRLANSIRKVATPATHVSVGLLLDTPCGRDESREDFLVDLDC